MEEEAEDSREGEEGGREARRRATDPENRSPTFLLDKYTLSPFLDSRVIINVPPKRGFIFPAELPINLLDSSD